MERIEGRKLTPPEVAKRFKVGTHKVVGWIRSGELAAINLANRGCTRPRYAIDPADIAAFERSRQVVPTPKPAPQKKRQDAGAREYF